MVDEQAELIPLILWNFGLASLVDPEIAARGETDLREGYEALRQMGKVGHFSAFCALLAQVSYGRGRYEEAAQYAREAAVGSRANDVHDHVSWRSTDAKLLARAGRHREAEELARESVSFAADSDFVLSQTEALSALAEVLTLAGRTDEAVEPLEQALQLYKRKGNVAGAALLRARLEDL